MTWELLILANHFCLFCSWAQINGKAVLFPSMRGRQNTGLKRSGLTPCSTTIPQPPNSGNNTTCPFTATASPAKPTRACSSWCSTAKAETWSSTSPKQRAQGRARGIRKMKLKLCLRFWESHMRGSSVLVCLSQDRKALSSTASAGCRRWTQTVNSCCVFNKPWNSSNKTVCWNDNVSFHSHILLQLWSNY